MASARDIRIDRQRDRSKLKYVIALPFGISKQNADCTEEIQNERE
jgi:hypothetical protein